MRKKFRTGRWESDYKNGKRIIAKELKRGCLTTRQLFLCLKNENRSRSSIEFQNLLTFKYANKLLKLYI